MAETMGGNITVVPGAREFSFAGSGTLSEGRLVGVATNVDPATGDFTVIEAAENSNAILGYVDTEWETGDYVVVYTGPAIARLYAVSALSIGDVVACGGNGEIKKYVGPAGAASSGCVVGVALENISAASFGKVFVNIVPNPVPGAVQVA